MGQEFPGTAFTLVDERGPPTAVEMVSGTTTAIGAKR